MTDKERVALRATENAIERAASIGVDARSLNAKSLAALVALFAAIDKCNEEGKAARAKLEKYRINPTNVSNFGVSRSTINSNEVLKAVVRYYGNKQDNEKVTVKRTAYENMKQELEMLRTFRDNSLSLGIENQHLRQELDQTARERDQTRQAYETLRRENERLKEGVGMDFNILLKNNTSKN